MSSSISLDSFFSKTIVDNNGNNCSDVNDGLIRLFGLLNEERYNLSEAQRYLVSEYEDGYPDLVALHSILQSEDYWWWILALNNLDDAFVDIKENWIYSINSRAQINNLISKSNEDTSSEASNIGKTIELN